MAGTAATPNTRLLKNMAGYFLSSDGSEANFQLHNSDEDTSTVHRDTAATPYRRLQEKMAGYFAPSNGSDADFQRKYSDEDIQNISSLLQYMDRVAWSGVPRIYIVLRRINQLQFLDAFIAQGIKDIWFPFSSETLPDLLGPSSKAEFLYMQPVVITKSIDLEKGENGRHMCFTAGESLPFRPCGFLGDGALGHVDIFFSLLSSKGYARKRKAIWTSKRIYEGIRNRIGRAQARETPSHRRAYRKLH